MKKLIALFCFLTSIQAVFTQNNDPDSLKKVLASYTKPIERFSATIKYLENTDTYQGNR